MVAGGVLVAGTTHPELGHVRPVRVRGDEWPGICPFHGSCVEGLASGPAIEARAGRPAPELAPDDPAWNFTAHAIAQLCHRLVLTGAARRGAARRIVIGGGVTVGVPHMFPRLRRMLADSLNSYIITAELGDMDTCLVPPRLGGQAGPFRASVLGRQTLAGAALAL